MSEIVIYGCGGHARSIINVICEKERKPDILLVDKNAKKDEVILGYRVVRDYALKAEDAYIIAIGDNRQRAEQYQALSKLRRGVCLSVISDFSLIGMDVQIGEGTFIAPNAYVGPQAVIGTNSIINTGSLIEHEVIIGNNTHIAPNTTICGRAQIGNNVLCGAGSIIIDQIRICDNVVIGAGTVVKENITQPGTYVGVPARKIIPSDNMRKDGKLC